MLASKGEGLALRARCARRARRWAVRFFFAGVRRGGFFALAAFFGVGSGGGAFALYCEPAADRSLRFCAEEISDLLNRLPVRAQQAGLPDLFPVERRRHRRT